MTKIKAYKGFNKDLTCRGFQYEQEKEFVTKMAECCKSGFHACEHPLDCFRYYSPNKSVYHEVEMSGDIDKQDSKICSTKIKVGARLSITDLVKAAIDFTMAKTKKENDTTGDYGASSATGVCGASSATGFKGASSATDSTGLAVAWGYEARAKGKKGTHLILADWRYIGKIDGDGDYCTPGDKDCWQFSGAEMLIVDGDKIKEDTYYSFRNGILTEIGEE